LKEVQNRCKLIGLLSKNLLCCQKLPSIYTQVGTHYPDKQVFP